MAEIQKQYEEFNEAIRLKQYEDNATLREKRDIVLRKLKERLLAHPSLDELFEGTGDDSGARDQRIYEAFRLHSYTLFQIPEHLGLHYSTISRIAKREAEKRMSKNKT